MARANILKLCLIALILLSGGSTDVRAQDNDALRFFQQNPQGRIWFRTEPQPRVRVRPRQPEENTVRRRPRPETPRVEIETAIAPVPSVAATTFVHVIGDSLSDLLAQGLKEQLAEKPEIGVMRRGRASSGLVRDDYHDWNKTLREIVGGTDKIDLLVMMVGSNDRQAIKDEAGSHEFMSERWREIYIRRIDDLISVAREKQVPLIWVGMPVMQSTRLSTDMLAINEILRDRVNKGGAFYVDIWEGFSSEQGQYAAIGPDINGQAVRLRTADGVHFTKAGYRKLGFFAGREVSRQLSRDRPGGVEIAAIAPDLSEELRRSAAPPTTPALSNPAILAPQILTDDVPLPVVVRVRPLAGALTALTAAPVTAGGMLFRARPAPLQNEMSIMIDQALLYGKSPPAKPGRSDDFRWPKE